MVDIGNVEFTSVDNYTFSITGVPHWSGGGTATPTDRADHSEDFLSRYMTLTLLWMIVAFIVGALLEKWELHRLPESGAVVIFGIIAGVIIRLLGSEAASVRVGARGSRRAPCSTPSRSRCCCCPSSSSSPATT